MAQTGYTPIQLYYSSTTTNAPLAANLAYGELAINITDGKLFYKDNANAIQVIGWKVVPATAGGTGQTSYAVGDLLYADTTTTLGKLPDVATGNALISGGVGVAPAWGKIGLTTHVSGTLPATNGGTGSNSAFTANGVVYANSTTTLITGSTLVFNGTNLGIGASPSTRLDVSQANAKSATGIWQVQIFDSTSQTTGVGGGISFGGYKTAQSAAEVFAGIDAYKENSTGGNAAGALRFHTQPSAGSGLVEAVRIGSTGNVTVSTGNLVIGTSGKGIDFSATAGTGTSELLADYEEGTWTPSDTSGAGLTLTITGTSTYTKIGRQVIANADITYPVTVDATLTLVGGLPFTTAAAPSGAGSIGYTDYGTWITPAPGGSVTAFRFVGATTFLTNAQLSGKRVQVTIIYVV
jgi:hypothetical protein